MATYQLWEQHFSTFTEFLFAIQRWQEKYLLDPLIQDLKPHLSRYREKFLVLQQTFLKRDPVVPSHWPTPYFYSQSNKRDVAAAARRYCLGIQPRGTHISLREATNKEQHVRMALQCRHPSTLISEVLDPTWQFVFRQFEESFRIRSLSESCQLAILHRNRMMEWIRTVAKELEPIKRKHNVNMPHSVRIISAHIHVPLLYTLLHIVDYPHPELAFRFFLGGPLVGTFTSPALPYRESKGDPLTDANIRAVAQKSMRACLRVDETLSVAGGKASMEKMQKDFDSGSQVGPFPTFDAMCADMENAIRQLPGLEDFELDRTLVIAVPQFSVEESHSTQEEELGEKAAVKTRNIWNGKPPNKLCISYNTYIPNNHADFSAIIIHWIQIFVFFSIAFDMHAWPSDFSSAYRQLPIIAMHIMFSGTCFWNYTTHRREWAYYRSLPFGSSLAPAGWSEVVHALCFVMAIAFLAILTHCVDDVCCAELAQLVDSSRACFIELCALIGLKLDMSKTFQPCTDLIYLGLRIILPCRYLGNDRVFSLSIPGERQRRLIGHLRKILDDESLSSGDASSHRGRLGFYTFWDQEARSYLVEFAARQYSDHDNTDLTEELYSAIYYFLALLQDPRFLQGVQPERILFRDTCVMYTDGALEGEGDEAKKGVGGVLFNPPMQTPWYFGETLSNDLPNFDRIAPIEMHAIHRALELFGDTIRNKAVLFFVDNTHAIGCLLKRSQSIQERYVKQGGDRKRRYATAFMSHHSPEWEYTHYSRFMELPRSMRRVMNAQSRAIWRLATQYNLLIWFEYVHTDCNIADPPSRGIALPSPDCAIRGRDFLSYHHSQTTFQ